MPRQIVTVIQARMGSTRLPGKVILPVLGKPVLVQMMERVYRSKLKGDVVIATSTNSKDDLIEEICREYGFLCFRGDEQDLLDRHYQVAKKWNADIILKIPSDCPLIDPVIIDQTISHFLSGYDSSTSAGAYADNFENNFDYVSNLHPASHPDGNDVEVMSFACLEKAWQEAKRPLEREHTTPYIWENPHLFKIGNVRWETGQDSGLGSGLDYSKSHRFTLDYEEDLTFIRAVYEALYPSKPHFTLNDILDLLQEQPDIYAINQKYAGEYWYRNYVGQLNTV